jgi:predicted acetyltransferase
MPQDAPSGLETRPISAEEFPAFLKVLFDAFGDDFRDDECEIESLVFEPERSLAVFDEDAIVGTAAIFSRELTVPGAVTPVAAVTMVGVAPTHRRRGLLTSLMGRQLTELHENEREPVAALWASEAGIYGRFGYGPAARGARLTTRTPRLRMRPGTDRGTGRIRRVELDHARADLRAVYEQLRPTTVGWLNRNGSWWDYRLWDPEHRRRGATALRAAVYEEPEGRVTGYVVYSIKSDWAVSEPNNEVRIRELAAATPEAHAATWGFVAELDLVRGLTARNRPLDEPLQHLLADPFAVELTAVDNLWVRVVDVGRALAARTYAQEIDVVLEVTDVVCPWNQGRWRLSGGPKGAACSRTTDAADIALTSTELGAAYLGGTSLSALAAAGRVDEQHDGAVAATSPAFAHDREPWCPEVF